MMIKIGLMMKMNSGKMMNSFQSFASSSSRQSYLLLINTTVKVLSSLPKTSGSSSPKASPIAMIVLAETPLDPHSSIR